MRPWFLATTSLTGSLFSNTNGPPSCIYLNHPVARDALTFTPLLVARGTRDIHEPLRALFFPPITTQDFGQVIGLDQSQRDMQTRLNSPGGPTLLLVYVRQHKVLWQPKERGEAKNLIKPLGVSEGMIPGKFFIFGSSGLAGNASKSTTHYEIY